MLSLIAFAANVATLTMPERAAIFVGAGATKRGARWMICKEDLNASARIDQIEDLNGDGRPEAVVGEDGTYCYGAAGTGFTEFDTFTRNLRPAKIPVAIDGPGRTSLCRRSPSPSSRPPARDR